MSSVEVGSTAPALDLALDDAEGNSHTVGEGLAAGPILIGIFKSSCQASKAMFPMLERLHQRYAGDGLTVLGVSQDSPNVSRSFARRYGITFPILIEPENYPVSTKYGIFATPTVYLIRSDQSVTYTIMGFLKPQVNELAAAVATELNRSPEPITPEDEPDVPMFVPG